MSAIAECIPFYAETDVDMPFGGAEAAAAPGLAALDHPIYVGAVDVGQRGVFGPLSLEVMLDQDRVELGPFVLPVRQAARLARLLGLAVAVLDAPALQPPAPLPESGRGIAGWDLGLARTTAELAAAGGPWEGETRP